MNTTKTPPVDNGMLADKKSGGFTIIRTPYGKDASSMDIATPEETKAKIGGGPRNLKHTLPMDKD